MTGIVASCTLPRMLGTRSKTPSTLFGRRLREARLSAGLSQAQLGMKLGMDDQNTAAPRVSRYETGKHEPDQDTLAQIADALGLPVAYFHATSEPLAKIILLVGKLPQDQQAQLSEQIERWISGK